MDTYLIFFAKTHSCFVISAKLGNISFEKKCFQGTQLVDINALQNKFLTMYSSQIE
jgi:hypothetical protein